MAMFRPRNTRRAKSLRNAPTDAERAMWSLLRSRGLGGAKFSRQIPVGPYFCDFLSRQHRLIVEVDGGQHDAAIDQVRSDFLESQGFRIIRFWNNDVLANPQGVALQILSALPTPNPSRSREGNKEAAP